MSAYVERNLIGALLTNERMVDKVIGIVTPEMFTEAFSREAYEEITECFTRGVEVDVVTLPQRLATDSVPEVLAREILGKCIAGEQSSFKADVYAREIRDEYRARKMSDVLNTVKPSGKNVDEQIRQTIANLETILINDGAEKSISQIVDENENQYFVKKNRKKIKIGFKGLDEALGGIEGGDMVIIAARPAIGKSALSLQIINSMAADGNKVGYFNLEMTENQIYERSLATRSGIELNRIRRATCFLNEEEEKIKKANDELRRQDKVIIHSGGKSVNAIRSEIRDKGYDVIVIDYLQLLKSDTKRGANRYAEVGDISRGIKAIAMDFNIPVIALSQLNRVSEDKKNREPTMAELRESGDIEQDASVILILWNPSKDSKTARRIKIEKARQGQLATQDLEFDGRFMTFKETNKKKNRDDEFVETDDDDDLPFV